MGIRERWQRFRPLPQDIKLRLSKLKSLFEKENILLCYIFGSSARRAGEDIDLALLPQKASIVGLRKKICEILSTERVDLVNLRNASPLLRFEIISKGVLLYKRDDEIENNFELTTLREYKDTAYLRNKQVKILRERIKMVLKKEVVLERLKELDTVLEELSKYKNKELEDLTKSLSMRWTIERGLIAAATFIFDIADHILSAKFGIYPETYEDSLRLLKDKEVISFDLYQEIKGLGGFRNILVHEYLKVDIDELYKNFLECFKIFPQFSKEVQKWLERTKD